MKIAVIYSSTEGQTRKISLFAFSQLTAAGHSVALITASDAGEVELSNFDKVVLAASVHAGHYQNEMIDFAKAQADKLNSGDTLFLSVSLGAASDDEKDWSELRRIADDFVQASGVTPNRIEHIAGAFRFSDYNFFEYWAMRWIESQREPELVSGTDREYTDWDALASLLKGWASE